MTAIYRHVGLKDDALVKRVEELADIGVMVEEFGLELGLGFPALALVQHDQIIVLVKLMPEYDPEEVVRGLLRAYDVTMVINKNSIHAPTQGSA